MESILARTHVRRTCMTYAFVLVILLILASMVEKGQDVLIVNNCNNKLSDDFFRLITYLGDGLIFVPIILIMFFVRIRTSITLALTGVLLGIVVSILKHVLFWEAGRPLSVLDKASVHFIEGVDVHARYSFPSGHTATIFAVSFALSLYFSNPMFRAFLLVIALLVGYSRIYLLQHFLQDVAEGAIVGSVIALTAYLIVEANPSFKWKRRYDPRSKDKRRPMLEPVEMSNNDYKSETRS